MAYIHFTRCGPASKYSTATLAEFAISFALPFYRLLLDLLALSVRWAGWRFGGLGITDPIICFYPDIPRDYTTLWMDDAFT